MNAKRTLVALLTLGAMAVAVDASAYDPQTEYADGGGFPSSSRNYMHTCRNSGDFMAGINVSRNQFLCTFAFQGFSAQWDLYNGNEWTDFSTQYEDAQHGVSIHVCPTGRAMVGFHEDKNELLCAPIGPVGNVRVDTGTQDTGLHLHRCMQGEVMLGIHVGKNLLVCGTPLSS